MGKNFLLLFILVILLLFGSFLFVVFRSKIPGFSKEFIDTTGTIRFEYPSSWKVFKNSHAQEKIFAKFIESVSVVPKNNSSSDSITFEVFSSENKGSLRERIPECTQGIKCRTISLGAYQAVVFSTVENGGKRSHSYIQKDGKIIGIYNSFFEDEKFKKESEKIIRSFTTL